ncbi:MAG TPA: 50S ribosomal protein L9 [Rhodocyclaceae bacterium]|nr:50S ribosomal protein L9 [Rhodocyclaceae bacterium]
MEIILMERVANLGDLGDVVKVRAGYARNFLIPKGKAQRVTTANLELFAQRRAELEQAQQARRAAAEGLKEKLEGLTVRIARKAGEDGRLFGSVSNFDIRDELANQGFDIERSAVRMPLGPLKATGDYPVEVAILSDVVTTINVSVVPE